MNVSQTVRNTVDNMSEGRVFGYSELPGYGDAPTAVIKAVSRLVADKRLQRLAKGRFYVAKKGVLGARKPSDNELIRSVTYKDGRIRGYVTGPSLYNALGLTTQLPRTVTVAYNGPRLAKDFGTIKLKTVEARAPITEDNRVLLQYLDVLKNIKKIPDSDLDTSLRVMKRKIEKLSSSEQAQLASLAERYYGPQARALLGMLYTDLKLEIPDSLVLSLNPITVYKLGIDENKWPNARKWNIQ